MTKSTTIEQSPSQNHLIKDHNMLKKSLLALSLTLPLQLSAWTYNSSYDSDGVPTTNLASPAVDLDQSVLDTMLASLPESSKAHLIHPEYFPASDPEIIINPDATGSTEVFVTFYSEGAGYRNSLGYYTYAGNERPSLVDVSVGGVVIFPNMSLPNSGGNLKTRTTVKLDRTFDPGTKIHFFLIANGWTGGGTVTENMYNFYSTDSSINPEDTNQTVTKNGVDYTIPDSKHVAMLWNQVDEAGNGILLMGYEDLRRPGGDNDFNDALFAVSTSPLEDLKDTVKVDSDGNETGFVTISTVNNDSDGDGIFNSFDAYPDDENRSSNSYYPSESGVATLTFEDQWPKKGDYDLNDLVVEFNIHEVKDASNKVKDITITGKFKAYGAGYNNGLAFAIDTPKDNIETLEFLVDGNNDTNSENQALIEDAVDGTTIVSVTSNARGYFYDIDKDNDYGLMINTKDFKADDSLYESKSFSITLTLKESAGIMGAPYNPFLYRNDGVNDIEVHLPGYKPTGNATEALFGTEDDPGDEYYVTKTNREPWALLIPTAFAHTKEKVHLYDAYGKFGSWVESGGALDINWYDNPSFVDTSKVVE